MELLTPEMSATKTVTRKHGDKDENKCLDNIYIYIYIHKLAPEVINQQIFTNLNTIKKTHGL